MGILDIVVDRIHRKTVDGGWKISQLVVTTMLSLIVSMPAFFVGLGLWIPGNLFAEILYCFHRYGVIVIVFEADSGIMYVYWKKS